MQVEEKIKKKIGCGIPFWQFLAFDEEAYSKEGQSLESSILECNVSIAIYYHQTSRVVGRLEESLVIISNTDSAIK